MWIYIARRTLWTIPVLVLATVFTFLLVTALPGIGFDEDPRLRQHPHIIENIKQKYGYDRSLPVRYAIWLKTFVTEGKMGPSITSSDRDVVQVLIERAPVSAQLGVIAFVFAAVVGTLFGIASALWRNTPIDYASTFISTIGFAIPIFMTAEFWVAFMGVKWNVTPVAGWETWQHRIGPAIVLGFAIMPYFTRLVRGNMLETLESDFVTTARAKGLRWRRTVFAHVLRNSLIPVITNAGPLAGFTITGSFVTEFIFNIPGLADAFIIGVQQRDYNLLLGATTLLAGLVIFLNLVVDLLYGFLDPRIRVA